VRVVLDSHTYVSALVLSGGSADVAALGGAYVPLLSEDNRVLECAVEGGADLIVTGDRAMLRLGRFEGVAIVSLRDFLTRLESPG
jgi:predicted nucleic acid-binding protein